MRLNLIFILIIITKLSYGQSDQLRVNKSKSYIKYEGDHLLHSWEGTNDKVNGLAILDPISKSLQKLAILLYVRDFDSQNSGRDAHALEVLEALKYPEIKFYSESIKIDNENLIINGIFDFHGKQIKKTFSASYKNQDSKWIIFGEFQLTPTDFNINLPSFLSIKMEDLLEIKYNVVLEN
tara:strand:+ start:37 stop:576 length:540 start_codon:yes stop_codon:yes gene_type:complete